MERAVEIRLFYLLGAVRTTLTNQDLNDITEDGIYVTNGVDSLSNKPISTLYNNIIEVKLQRAIETKRVVQTFYSFNDRSQWVRSKNELGWSEWSRNDGYGCSSVSDLASLLGVSGKTVVGLSRNNSQVLAGCGAQTIIAVQSSVIMSFNGFVAFCAYGTGARIIGDVANSSGAKDTSEKINFYLDTDGKCYVQNLAFDNFSFTYKIIA